MTGRELPTSRMTSSLPDRTTTWIQDFWLAARAHAGIAVPLLAAALIAVVNWSFDIQQFAFDRDRAQSLIVPPEFVPESDRVPLVARGLFAVFFIGLGFLGSAWALGQSRWSRTLLLVVGTVAVALLAWVLTLGNLNAALALALGWPVLWFIGLLLVPLWGAISRTMGRFGPVSEAVASVGLLLAWGGAVALLWVFMLTALEYGAEDVVDPPLDEVWVLRGTESTRQPVLVLYNGSGEPILRPLPRVASGRFAPSTCDPQACRVASGGPLDREAGRVG